MELPRTIRFVGEVVAVASVGTLGAYGGATLLAQPPRPLTLMDFLLLIITLALVAAALVLTVVLGLPLLRAGYRKTSMGLLPARPLLLAALVTVLGSLSLAYFHVFSGREVISFIGTALLTAWLSYERYAENSAPEA